MEQVHRAIHEAVLEAGPKQLAHLMGDQCGLRSDGCQVVRQRPGRHDRGAHSLDRRPVPASGSVLLIDYIQLISAESSSNRSLEVGKISTALKNLAKELKIPVIVLAQLYRGSTNRPDKRPRTSDIRDSGQIEHDADVVILVHRDMESKEGQNGVTELIVGKVRHTRVGSCMVQQQGKYVRFVDFEGRTPSNEEVEMGRSFASRFKGSKNHE